MKFRDFNQGKLSKTCQGIRLIFLSLWLSNIQNEMTDIEHAMEAGASVYDRGVSHATADNCILLTTYGAVQTAGG